MNDPRFEAMRRTVLLRPAMYFGTVDRDADALSPFLSRWCRSVIDAGARELSVTLRTDGVIELSYARADSTREFHREVIGACSTLFEESLDGARTTVRFRIDSSTFPMLTVRSPYRLSTSLRDAATAVAGSSIELVDDSLGLQVRMRYPRGCADRLLEEAGDRRLNHAFQFTGSTEAVRFDVAFGWCDTPGLHVVALTNGERNSDGGAHVDGVWEGVAAALAPMLGATTQRPFRAELLPRNAIVVVSVHLEAPAFGGTRACLHDVRAGAAIHDAVQREFVAQLGQARLGGSETPWYLLGGVRLETPWLQRFASYLADGRLDQIAGPDSRFDPDFEPAVNQSLEAALKQAR